MLYTPEQILHKIGCSNKESKIYLACLAYGGLTVTGIHRKTSFPRTTIYDVVEKMEFKGFLTKAKRVETLTFYAVSVQELMVILEDKIQGLQRKKNILQDHIPEFQKLIIGTDIVPQIKLYQGNEAITLIYNQVKFARNIKTIYSLSATKKHIEELTKNIHENHEIRGVQKQILLAHSPKALEEKKHLTSMGFSVKILPEEKFIHADLMIMDEKVLFVSYGTQIEAIEIIQPVFVNTQRNMFDLIWNSLT